MLPLGRAVAVQLLLNILSISQCCFSASSKLRNIDEISTLKVVATVDQTHFLTSLIHLSVTGDSSPDLPYEFRGATVVRDC